MKITVTPSNNIFSELGNNTYDYKDLLSELIDNSIAARNPHELLQVIITAHVDAEMRPKKFVIQDNASGIPVDKLGLAITPAGLQTNGSLNEHGLGMKQAVAALGKLESLVTKTQDRDLAICVNEFRFGDIEATEIQFDKPHGTTITVTDAKPIVVAHTTSITRTIIPYLGARYRRFLRPEKPELDLTLDLVNIDNGKTLYHWAVKEVKPIYFHPNTRENRPVIQRHTLEGHGWKAELTMGYAPKDHTEYEEMGIDIPNKFHPYRVSISTQGLDVILHDRIILFHQLAELEIVGQRHNDYNPVRGEIVLLHGFHTAITKNSIIHDDHFRACVSQIREILTGERPGPGGRQENYLQRKSYPDEIPEKLLRDRLIEWLRNNPIQPRSEVQVEYAVAGIEGFIDILADGEAWELKRDQASALDAYQLFMYMDIADIKKGYLLAKSFSPGAHVAAKFIQDKHGLNILLTTLDQFPICQHPNAQEREDYY